MTAPQAIYLDPDILAILNRCYRGERNRDVIARAVRLLAEADGHLRPDGTPKAGYGGRTGRRTP